MRALIVTADDFGLSVEVNEAVELAYREGILSAASLMVTGPAAADAVRRARTMPGLRIGLHLVLVDGDPASPRDDVSRLVDGSGRLRVDMAGLGLSLAYDRESRRQMRREIESQFAAFAATGLPLDHVNAHKHFHVHPIIAGYVLDSAAKAGAEALRAPIEPLGLLRAVEPTPRGAESTLATTAARLLRARARRAGFMVADRVLGLRWSGAMTEARLAGLVRHLPDGLTEIYCHPAVDDRFPGAVPGYRYADELRALLSPDCAEILSETGTLVGSYRSPRKPEKEVA